MLTPSLDSFAEERAILAALRGEEEIERAWPRLEEIYYFTEARWWDYVKKLHNTPIRYVAIGEAPPWSAVGHPLYILDPDSADTRYRGALRFAFRCAKNDPVPQVLDRLAESGLLWLDSIPFALEYTSAQRRKSKYRALVWLTLQNYVLPKVAACSLKFAASAKIAFALRLNAEAIFRNARQLLIGGHKFHLSESLIVADASGYPNGPRMREVFGLGV